MRFTINGIDWTIEFVNSRHPKLMRDNSIYALAVTDNNDKCIYINNRLYGPMLEKVLNHEMVHVFSFSYSLIIPVETEELIADFLATYGKDIFRVADDILFRFAGVLYG